MNKGNSIDCSFYLDKANSQCKFKQTEYEAPYSDLVPDISTGDFILPYLWFDRIRRTYYISCEKKQLFDIQIGILIPNVKRTDLHTEMLKTKEGYLFDSDDKNFHFLSLNWLDSENTQGSKTYKENICFGDYSEDFLDSLYGYVTQGTGVQIRNGLYWFNNIDNSNGLALENNKLCMDNYLRDSYAGYCYRYYTNGTKQGDWHMIDLNTFEIFVKFGQTALYTILDRTRQAVGDGGSYSDQVSLLSAFTWLDVHGTQHGEELKQNGILGRDYIGSEYYKVDKTQRCAALAQLKLPVSMFKFND